MKKLIIFLLPLLLISCSNDDDSDSNSGCNDGIVFGLNVRFLEQNTNTVIDAVGTVQAFDGDYSEYLTKLNFGPEYIGAQERAGTYILEIDLSGYVPKTSEAIVVEEDECHVIAEQVTIYLQPE